MQRSGFDWDQLKTWGACLGLVLLVAGVVKLVDTAAAVHPVLAGFVILLSGGGLMLWASQT